MVPCRRHLEVRKEWVCRGRLKREAYIGSFSAP